MLTFTTDALPATTVQSQWIGVLSPNLSGILAKNPYTTTTVAITKRVVRITQFEEYPVYRFGFEYKDGTTITAGPVLSSTSTTFPRTFAGTFLGMRCKYHTNGALDTIDKLEACNIYEDQLVFDTSTYMFVETIPDFTYTLY